jgi:hypothetical protein
MFCGECGTQNPDTNQFCRNCGKPLTRRQPAAQSLAQPAPVPSPYPAAQPAPVAPQPSVVSAAPVQVSATAPKRKRNWLGILSLVLGILSWIILTGVFAMGAILIGIISFVWFRKASGKIGISSLIGIVFGIAALAVVITLP